MRELESRQEAENIRRMRERKDAAILRQYGDWMDVFGRGLYWMTLILLVVLVVTQLGRMGV